MLRWKIIKFNWDSSKAGYSKKNTGNLPKKAIKLLDSPSTIYLKYFTIKK